jgi:chromatin remodeling complex protein RSC6
MVRFPPRRLRPAENSNQKPNMPTATKSKRKANPALLKPVQPDATLAVIVGSTPLPRGQLTKKVWDYIKKHKLQDPKKKTQINADAALKAVFGGKSSVTMFEMTKHVSGHVK